MTHLARGLPQVVLFDRDGTLIVDVPYNADPDLVEAMPTAVEALGLLRSIGIQTGVVTNQSGIGRGILTAEEVERVNRRIDEMLGPFDAWCVCPHRAEDCCECRKPRPGLILRAARELAVPPGEIALIGDIGADMTAAAAAGATAVMVPTRFTRFGEVIDAPLVASDLIGAVRLVLAGLLGGDADDSTGEPGAGNEREE